MGLLTTSAHISSILMVVIIGPAFLQIFLKARRAEQPALSRHYSLLAIGVFFEGGAGILKWTVPHSKPAMDLADVLELIACALILWALVILFTLPKEERYLKYQTERRHDRTKA